MTGLFDRTREHLDRRKQEAALQTTTAKGLARDKEGLQQQLFAIDQQLVSSQAQLSEVEG